MDDQQTPDEPDEPDEGACMDHDIRWTEHADGASGVCRVCGAEFWDEDEDDTKSVETTAPEPPPYDVAADLKRLDLIIGATIAKLDYSANPWRALIAGSEFSESTGPIVAWHDGDRPVSAPPNRVWGRTRAECEAAWRGEMARTLARITEHIEAAR